MFVVSTPLPANFEFDYSVGTTVRVIGICKHIILFIFIIRDVRKQHINCNTEEMAIDFTVANLRGHLANMKIIQEPDRYFRKIWNVLVG